MVHYCVQLMGVVVFAKVQGQVKFENPRTLLSQTGKSRKSCSNKAPFRRETILTYIHKYLLTYILTSFLNPRKLNNTIPRMVSSYIFYFSRIFTEQTFRFVSKKLTQPTMSSKYVLT